MRANHESRECPECWSYGQTYAHGQTRTSWTWMGAIMLILDRISQKISLEDFWNIDFYFLPFSFVTHNWNVIQFEITT
jgi:hypothetical protein